MSDWDVTPRAARRLRTFGRPDAPSDTEMATLGTDEARATDPLADLIGAPDASSPGTTPHTSIWDRRRHHQPDPDAVDIALETSHAWWAQRENLELLVNPKKRGAAARARRAAEAAFAPPSSRSSGPHPPPGPATGTAGSQRSTWDPSHVYSWAGNEPGAGDRSDEVPSTASPATRTPWDVLGLTSDASWVEVTRRHKQLAKQHHPDRHGTSDAAARSRAESLMSEINAAYGDLKRIYRATDGL